MNGRVVWEGQGDAFGVFSLDDASSLPIEDLGVYDDPSQLVARGLAPKLGWAEQARWNISTALVNRRIKSLRRSIRRVRPIRQDAPAT